MDTAICYKDRDNSFFLTLKKNNVVLSETDMGAITKFEIKFNGAYYDSDTTPAGFTRNDAAGTVQIKPFELDLSVSNDVVELIVYDTGDYTHGLVWDQFRLSIKSDASAAVA